MRARTRLTRLAVAAVAFLVGSLLLACIAGGSAAMPASRPGTASSPSRHVFVIVMENHEYGSIVGSSKAPFINRTLIRGGTLFTKYHAVSHPSLPNYLAMTSGGRDGKAGTDSITAGEIRVNNVFHQMFASGIAEKSYEQDLPRACYTGGKRKLYAIRHDPEIAYSDVTSDPGLCKTVVPLKQLAKDLTNHSLPALSFVTPNLCKDMHNCSIATGDAWLSIRVPPLLAAGATVIVTFDEGSTSSGGGGHVMTVEDGPRIQAGAKDATAYSHFGLLAGIERAFGLPRLQNAATSRPLPIP